MPEITLLEELQRLCNRHMEQSAENDRLRSEVRSQAEIIRDLRMQLNEDE